jgi:hypothetical protein
LTNLERPIFTTERFPRRRSPGIKSTKEVSDPLKAVGLGACKAGKRLEQKSCGGYEEEAMTCLDAEMDNPLGYRGVSALVTTIPSKKSTY